MGESSWGGGIKTWNYGIIIRVSTQCKDGWMLTFAGFEKCRASRQRAGQCEGFWDNRAYFLCSIFSLGNVARKKDAAGKKGVLVIWVVITVVAIKSQDTPIRLQKGIQVGKNADEGDRKCSASGRGSLDHLKSSSTTDKRQKLSSKKKSGPTKFWKRDS